MGMRIIEVTSFKSTGKFYTNHKSNIKLEHENLASWELIDLIKSDDDSVQSYSGLSIRYSQEPDFYFLVDDSKYGRSLIMPWDRKVKQTAENNYIFEDKYNHDSEVSKNISGICAGCGRNICFSSEIDSIDDMICSECLPSVILSKQDVINIYKGSSFGNSER